MLEESGMIPVVYEAYDFQALDLGERIRAHRLQDGESRVSPKGEQQSMSSDLHIWYST
jgi:hypothetical protein